MVSDAIPIVAVRNVYVAAREEEALATMQPRLQWAGDLAVYLRSPVSALARAGDSRDMNIMPAIPLSVVYQLS